MAKRLKLPSSAPADVQQERAFRQAVDDAFKIGVKVLERLKTVSDIEFLFYLNHGPIVIVAGFGETTNRLLLSTAKPQQAVCRIAEKIVVRPNSNRRPSLGI